MRLVASICLVAFGLTAAALLAGCGNPEVGTVGPQAGSETATVGGGSRGAAPTKSNRGGGTEHPVTRETRK